MYNAHEVLKFMCEMNNLGISQRINPKSKRTKPKKKLTPKGKRGKRK